MPKTIKKDTSLEDVSGETTNKEIVAQDEKPVNLDEWINRRKEFKSKIVDEMKEGLHFHKIKFGSKEVQTLSKGGAEMVASAFGWTAEFVKDSDTWEMMGSLPGTVCYICKLSNGKFIGEGRGARYIKQDNGDMNKCIKMAQKSAFVDAVLRASGLSDLFTQDLDENPAEAKSMHVEAKPVQTAIPNSPHVDASDKQKRFIEQLADRKRLDLAGLKQMFPWFTGIALLSKSDASLMIETLTKYIPKESITIQQNDEIPLPEEQ